MKPALVSLYHENYQALGDVVLPNMQAYCDRHGYYLLVFKGECGSGPIGFQKMRYLKALMNDGLELALVVDLDILISDLEKPFTDFIAHDLDGSYFVTKDVNGINNGSFIIRKTGWSMHLLQFMLENMHMFTCEQNVLKELESQLIGPGQLKVLPHPSINQYLHDVYPEYVSVPFPNCWKPGDFLLHLPGLHLDKRLAILAALKRGEVLT